MQLVDSMYYVWYNLDIYKRVIDHKPEFLLSVSFSVVEAFMKHSALVCCGASVSQSCKRCLKQIRMRSQSSFVFTAEPSSEALHPEDNPLQTARKGVGGEGGSKRDEFILCSV